MDPTDEDLIAFARSMIGDDTEPFLAPEILPKAVAKNRDLWVMLCRVSNGLEHVPVGYERDPPLRPPRGPDLHR